jgi:antitoxin ParD1/3/4
MIVLSLEIWRRMMSKPAFKALGEPFESFVDGEVAAGHYESREDVVRAGLNLLDERARRRERLRAALQAGLDSGEAREFDFAELFDGEEHDDELHNGQLKNSDFDEVTGERLAP